MQKQIWPLPEKFFERPTHKNFLIKIPPFVAKIYPETLVKKYEFNLYDEDIKNCIPAWQNTCAKKIDCVIEISDEESDIIETDSTSNAENLGQLIMYKILYEKQTGRRIRNQICLCKTIDNQTAKIMKSMGIKIYTEKNEIYTEIL